MSLWLAPLMLAACWLITGQTWGRISFTIWVLLAFGVAILVARVVESRGGQIVIDRTRMVVCLPWYRVERPLDDVVGFQWMAGETQVPDELYGVTLSLLVREGEILVRYKIADQPLRSQAKMLAKFADKPVMEVRCPRGTVREMDARNWQDPPARSSGGMQP